MPLLKKQEIIGKFNIEIWNNLSEQKKVSHKGSNNVFVCVPCKVATNDHQQHLMPLQKQNLSNFKSNFKHSYSGEKLINLRIGKVAAHCIQMIQISGPIILQIALLRIFKDITFRESQKFAEMKKWLKSEGQFVPKPK